jgi:hypothetical protein
MEITTYNDHLKAPFFPVVFVVKQRILCRTGAFALIQSFLLTQSCDRAPDYLKGQLRQSQILAQLPHLLPVILRIDKSTFS